MLGALGLIGRGKLGMLPRETSSAFTMANDVAGAERLNARERLDQRSIDLRRLVISTLDGGGLRCRRAT